MHYKKAKKFEEKKASIYLCPVVKETPYFSISAIAGQFS